jgi:hypothetical protein
MAVVDTAPAAVEPIAAPAGLVVGEEEFSCAVEALLDKVRVASAKRFNEDVAKCTNRMAEVEFKTAFNLRLKWLKRLREKVDTCGFVHFQQVWEEVAAYFLENGLFTAVNINC